MKTKPGFTLIELMVVIAIISMLAIAGFASYLNSLKSGSDARRKADLSSLQKGLELYYQDVGSYPLPSANGVPETGGKFCYPGAGGCAIATYLQALPNDKGTAYYYSSDGTSYKLYSCIENTNDAGVGVQQSGYAGTTCASSGRCNICRYGVSSSNTTP